jgi:PHD/YefM family antitoxin component YafN of YafNO toxin-antitoxin module
VTKLLEQVIEQLRHLPEGMQDNAARAVMLQLEEEPEPGDLEAIAEGRAQIERGEFITLDQLEHDLGSNSL